MEKNLTRSGGEDKCLVGLVNYKEKGDQFPIDENSGQGNKYVQSPIENYCENRGLRAGFYGQ